MKRKIITAISFHVFRRSKAIIYVPTRQIPARPHSGSWDHIEEMLNVSAAPKISNPNLIPIFIHVLIATLITKVISS